MATRGFSFGGAKKVVDRCRDQWHGQHYGGVVGHGVNQPIGTVTAADHHNLVTSNLVKLRGTCRDGQPVTEPMVTISAQGLHPAEVRAFLIKYFGTAQDPRLDEPLHTVTSKHRFGLVTVHGEDHVIADIGLRMLPPRELYRAQGIHDEYIIDSDFEGNPSRCHLPFPSCPL